jgi:hypothetical protein
MHFENELAPIRQGYALFEHPRFTSVKNLLHVAIIANGRALVEYLIAKSADYLLVVQVKELHEGFICLENAKLLVINAKRVRYAVKNPSEELFIVITHMASPCFRALNFVDDLSTHYRSLR